MVEAHVEGFANPSTVGEAKARLRIMHNRMSVINELFRRYDKNKQTPSLIEIEDRAKLRLEITRLESWLKGK